MKVISRFKVQRLKDLKKSVQQAISISRWNSRLHYIQIHSELCCWFGCKSFTYLVHRDPTAEPGIIYRDLMWWRDKGCGWLALCLIVAHLKTGMCYHSSDLIRTLSRLASVASGQTRWCHVCICNVYRLNMHFPRSHAIWLQPVPRKQCEQSPTVLYAHEFAVLAVWTIWTSSLMPGFSWKDFVKRNQTI